MLPLKYTDPAGRTRNAMYWIYEKMFYPVAGVELGSLLFALSFTAVIWLVCRELWRRKIFVKI
jgi:predicted acyltransferase